MILPEKVTLQAAASPQETKGKLAAVLLSLLMRELSLIDSVQSALVGNTFEWLAHCMEIKYTNAPCN